VLELFGVHGGAEVAQSSHGVHDDGAAARFHLRQHEVVPQAGRGHRSSSVRFIFFELCLGKVAGCEVLTQPVKGLCLEEQEPGTHRAVAVLESGRGEAVFHHGQLGTHLRTHGVGGTRVPYRVPGTALAFALGTRHVDVYSAAAGHHHGLALDDIHFVFTHAEAHRAGDGVFLVGIQQQLHDEDPFQDVLFAKGLFGCFCHDALVRLAVDHDLPLAGTDRLGA